MAVTLPFVLLLVDVWPLGNGGRWRPRFVEKIPLAALAAADSLATIVFQRHAGAVQKLSALSIGDRLATAPVAYVKALTLTFFPHGARLSIRPQIPDVGVGRRRAHVRSG